jgi:elongation factor Ts
MMIDARLIKKLRDRTGISVMECKRALEKTQGNLEQAAALLKELSVELAKKKKSRLAQEGTIGAYVHTGGKIGVLVELNCETDFVARNEKFQALLKDICLQVAASSPSYVDHDEIPQEVLERGASQFGTAETFLEAVCLLEQPFIKDTARKVRDVIEEAVSTFGENIRVRRFTRLEMGQYEGNAT